MDEVLYLIMAKTKETFQIIFAGESGKTSEETFFTSNPKFQCWVANAAFDNNIYLCIYPMWDSTPEQRQRILRKIIEKYSPVCNES